MTGNSTSRIPLESLANSDADNPPLHSVFSVYVYLMKEKFLELYLTWNQE